MLPHSGGGMKLKKRKENRWRWAMLSFHGWSKGKKRLWMSSPCTKRPKPQSFATIKCPKSKSFSVTAIKINRFLFVKNPPINVLFFRHTVSFQKKLDLKALCEDGKSMLPSTYLATYCYHSLSVILVFCWQCTASLLWQCTVLLELF
jgi:hypothetical protein